MKPAAILVVVLSNQGYWFGGQAGRVSIRWAVKDDLPESVLVWDLRFGSVRVAGDRVAVHPNDRPSVIEITPPAVRVRTTMRWVYRLERRDGGADLARGDETVHVFPADPLASVRERMRARKVIVWDRPDGLPGLLSQARIPHSRIDHPSKLEFASADVILVGPDQIDASPFSQSALLGQAEGGCSVLLFAQKRPPRLAGYPLARRPVPAKLEWRANHPLFAGFRPDDLRGWLGAWSSDLRAVQLPADEPALEVAYWPRETPGEEPVPIDALLLVKAVGAGRLVLCQLPLGPWETDPRSQLFVRNALSYLLTRPEPTPPPSRRRAEQPRERGSLPTITIPSGVKP